MSRPKSTTELLSAILDASESTLEFAVEAEAQFFKRDELGEQGEAQATVLFDERRFVISLERLS